MTLGVAPDGVEVTRGSWDERFGAPVRDAPARAAGTPDNGRFRVPPSPVRGNLAVVPFAYSARAIDASSGMAFRPSADAACGTPSEGADAFDDAGGDHLVHG